MRLSNMLKSYMDGPGGRNQNNGIIQGMTLKSLKHHKALQPLFVIMAGGIAFVGWYIFRLASGTTDINWMKKDEPWNYYKNKQFKFMNPHNIDYSTISKVPNYKD